MSMTRRTIPLALLALLALVAGTAGAQPTKVRKEQSVGPTPRRDSTATVGSVAAPTLPREIAVTATSRARVAADRATLALLVEGAADDAPFAAQRAEDALVNVSEAIRQLDSAVTTLGTTSLGVVATPSVSGFRHIPGRPAYRARYVLRVQVARPGDVARVAATALAAGARAMPPSFESVAADSVRRATYADALARARHDAETIASAMGARLGDVVDVTTAEPSPAAPDASSSDVVVATSLKVRYRLLPR